MLAALNAGPWGEGSQAVPLNHVPKLDDEDRYLMRTVLTGSHKMANLALLHKTFGGPAIASPVWDKVTPAIFQHPEMNSPLGERYIQKMFDVLDDVLPGIEHLIAIGYSFADEHVNERIHRWMLEDSMVHLSIVSPSSKGVPPFLRDVADDRVECIPMGATEYLSALME